MHELELAPQPHTVNPRALQVEHRGLREGAEHLVRTLHGDVGPRLHRRLWQLWVKGKMRSVRFIDEQHHVGLMREISNRL